MDGVKPAGRAQAGSNVRGVARRVAGCSWVSQACVRRELAERAVEASSKRKSACRQRRASSHTPKVPHVVRVYALQGKGGRGGVGLIQDYNSPVWVGAGGLLLGGDDGLQVLLSALLTRVLAAVGRGSVGDLLGLIDRSLLDPV